MDDHAQALPWQGGFEGASANAETTLVVRAQAGETVAFDSLMRTYRERLFGVIFNLTNNREDAADLTQEAFIRAFSKIQSYNFRSSFFTWIYRIAVNLALNNLRHKKFRSRLMLEKWLPTENPQERMEELAARPKQPNPDQSELQLELNKAMQKLSEEHRTVVVLAEVEGLPLKEVAEILRTSEGTVKSRLHYAKKQLQTLLKPYLNI